MLRLTASWFGVPGLAVAPAATIDGLSETLVVEADPNSDELEPMQSEMVCYG
jgi:hypothetical protein